jgi:predicted ATPase
MTCFRLGEFTAGRAYLEKALALYAPAHRPSNSEFMTNDVSVWLLRYSSWPLACLGHPDRALFHREEALAAARQLSHPLTLALALIYALGTGWHIRADPKSLLQYADEAAVAVEHGLGLLRAVLLIYRGWCLAALGRADQGIPLLTTGLAGVQDGGFMIFRPWYLTLSGDACRIAGLWQAAIGHLAKARRLADETGERWIQAETLRLTGDVLAATGDPPGAEASYREAIAIAQRQSAKLWELRAATSVARLRRDQGKVSQACDLLAPVCGWFTEGLDTNVLKDAKALLEKLTA